MPKRLTHISIAKTWVFHWFAPLVGWRTDILAAPVEQQPYKKWKFHLWSALLTLVVWNDAMSLLSVVWVVSWYCHRWYSSHLLCICEFLKCLPFFCSAWGDTTWNQKSCGEQADRDQASHNCDHRWGECQQGNDMATTSSPTKRIICQHFRMVPVMHQRRPHTKWR